MANSLLNQGISILYDMEINNYMMTRSIEKLNREMASLGKSRSFRSPRQEEKDISIMGILFTVTIISAIIGAVVGVISGFVIGEGFFGKIGQAIVNLLFLGIYFAIAGAVLGFIIGIVSKVIGHNDSKKKYESACRDYDETLRKDKQRVERENQQKAYLMKQRDELYYKREKSKKLLNEFYLKMNIDKNYRNLIPIGYMYEFMRLGIATKLEGADGLYYLVLRELKADQLQYTLEEISGKLDKIIDKQRDIYRELVKTNQRCDELVQIAVEHSRKATKSLNRIENNTRIAAYNSERTAKEISYQNFMLTYHVL